MDIQLDHISKSFGGRKVLEDFSCTFKSGETACIMGRSGCGKTTLLHIILGLLKPDAGTVYGMPKSVGVVFQEDRLLEGFSLQKNIAVASREVLSESVIRSHMEATGLTDAGNKPARELSGGMKRRGAIIRAVLCGGSVLIMDEPFKGLDEMTRKRTADYINTQAAEKTVIMVTHDPDEVALMGGRLIQVEFQDLT